MEVLGVDLSTNMIDIGKQRAKEFEDDKVLMSDGFAVSISVSPIIILQYDIECVCQLINNTDESGANACNRLVLESIVSVEN